MSGAPVRQSFEKDSDEVRGCGVVAHVNDVRPLDVAVNNNEKVVTIFLNGLDGHGFMLIRFFGCDGRHERIMLSISLFIPGQ